MKNVNILNALSRKSVGTNSSKKVRQANQIPAIIYGDGIKPEAISLAVVIALFWRISSIF